MSSVGFGWEELLRTDAPSGSSLKAALLTTYDRADERILVEHLLPLLLKLSREPGGEGAERQYFLLELDRRLKQLHDKLIVVSSTAREEPPDPDDGESGSYGWIWRSIRYLTVGSRRKAVQHAKLWLLHWGAAEKDGSEYLELVVSSANLTRSAFKGQLQAAWRACIQLHPQRSALRLARWGVLPKFLQELAVSAGDDDRLAPFVELLARADCSDGVTFVASVPGIHSGQVLRRTPWGVAALRTIMPRGRGGVRVSILSPYIGSWSTDALNRWCDAFEGSPSRLELVWIDKNHPWARAGRWLLPKSTLDTLMGGEATLRHLRYESNHSEKPGAFHEEQRWADDRWCHAKIYALTRGTSRRLLVTSANFSAAAWGSESSGGELIIENFELGVCLDQAAWPLDLEVFENEKDAAIVSHMLKPSAALITWARASWDGKNVGVECRCEAGDKLKGTIHGGGIQKPVSNWTVGADDRFRSTRVPWADAEPPPSSVQLIYGHDTVNVPVFDERPFWEREGSVPPEVDENVVQTMRDQLLFEQYGGPVVAELHGEQPIGEGEESSDNDPEMDGNSHEDYQPGDDLEELFEADDGGRADSYAVPALVLARRHLRVVDNWAVQARRAANIGNAQFEQKVLRRDCELLIEAFQRQAVRDAEKGSARAIGAKLAAEELTQRLKHFPET